MKVNSISDKKIKTSFTIKTSILQQIDEYRANLRPIPSKTETIEKLLLLALANQQKLVLQKQPEKQQEKQPIKQKDDANNTAKKTLDYAKEFKNALSKPF